MKKTNKGFSLVELIIVIAIMAILAGALAPALIKYINKSRLSTDIQTAQTVATAIQTAISSEKAYDAACAAKYQAVQAVSSITATTDDFTTEFASGLGTDPANIEGKAKKDLNNSPLDGDIYFSVDPTNNDIKVYVGGTATNNLAYPTVDSALAN